jgi:hypothetical protein
MWGVNPGLNTGLGVLRCGPCISRAAVAELKSRGLLRRDLLIAFVFTGKQISLLIVKQKRAKCNLLYWTTFVSSACETVNAMDKQRIIQSTPTIFTI